MPPSMQLPDVEIQDSVDGPAYKDFADYAEDKELEAKLTPGYEDNKDTLQPTKKTADFRYPPVLSDGDSLPVVGKMQERTQMVSCEDGDVRLLAGNIEDPRQEPKCAKGGVYISSALRWQFFPAIHSCVRDLLEANPSLGKWPQGTPLEVIHAGIFNDRNVNGNPAAKDLRSLHSFARAIDVIGFRAGTATLYYKEDLAAGDSNPRLTDFWYKIRDCLQSAESFVVLDARYNSAHRDHIHISLKYEQHLKGVAAGAPAR